MFNRHEAGRITFQELFDYHVICRGWQSQIAIYVVLFLSWDKFTKPNSVVLYRTLIRHKKPYFVSNKTKTRKYTFFIRC